MGSAASSTALGSALHVIQVAITPVFMLAGIAALLNVFTTRFARVADQADAVSKVIKTADAAAAALLSRRLARLRLRSLVLDVAVILGAVAGAATCATVLALFVGEAGGFPLGVVLFTTFGLAVACALAAIVSFAIEMMIASRHVRDVVAAEQERMEP
jgi:hypothetical protein